MGSDGKNVWLGGLANPEPQTSYLQNLSPLLGPLRSGFAVPPSFSYVIFVTICHPFYYLHTLLSILICMSSSASACDSVATVTVLFFASCSELAGTKHAQIEVTRGNLPGSGEGDHQAELELGPEDVPLAALVRAITERYPKLSAILPAGVAFAHNQEFVDPTSSVIRNVRSGDEIAILPPISGG